MGPKKTFGFETNFWTEKNFGSEKKLLGLVRLCYVSHVKLVTA